MVYRKYIILGQPAVKKNGQKVSFAGSRPRKYNTVGYKKWQHWAEGQILEQGRPNKPIDEPIILLCKFFMQTKRRVDLSNLYEGIQDVLVEMGVLADDHSGIVIGHDGSRVLYDKDNPRIEVIIRTESEQNPPTLPQ